jgi:DNA-binding transcriptional LysR family regulator
MSAGTRYVDAFVAAVETGGFRAASERLHVTQSTISYQIRQLEDWMGQPLFERVGRRVLLTEAGRRLYQSCERFLAEVRALRAATQGGEPLANPLVRIATGSSFGRYVLTPLLAQPEWELAHVHLQFCSDAETFDAVANGRADIGFCYTMRASDVLRFDPIYTEQLALIASPAARPRGVSLERWVQESGYVTYDECDPVFQRWFEAALGRMPPRIRAVGHCTEVEEVVALVASGRGLSVVPRHAIGRELKQGAVKEIRLKGRPMAANTIYAVRRETGALPAAIEWLVGEVKAGSC